MRSYRTSSGNSNRARGFTLVEMLVVIAIIAIVAVITIPALHKMIVRSRLEGFASEVSGLMQRARLEAVKRSVPTVMRVDFENDELVVFVDVDFAVPGNAGVFNPDTSVPPGDADFELIRRRKPAKVAFQGPDDGEEGADAVNGFTVNPEDGSLPNQAVFNPDGSIEDPGGFRLADPKGNILEVRVAPQATARVELRKYDPSYTNPEDLDDKFRAQDEGGKPWHWIM